MSTTAPLTVGQRWLLSALNADGRIWRSRAGCRLVSPYYPWTVLTDDTVGALLAAGLLVEKDTYGKEQAVYEISAAGRQTLASIHA